MDVDEPQRNSGYKRNHSNRNIIPQKIQRINTHQQSEPQPEQTFRHMEEADDTSSTFLG